MSKHLTYLCVLYFGSPHRLHHGLRSIVPRKCSESGPKSKHRYSFRCFVFFTDRQNHQSSTPYTSQSRTTLKRVLTLEKLISYCSPICVNRFPTATRERSCTCVAIYIQASMAFHRHFKDEYHAASYPIAWLTIVSRYFTAPLAGDAVPLANVRVKRTVSYSYTTVIVCFRSFPLLTSSSVAQCRGRYHRQFPLNYPTVVHVIVMLSC